MLVATGSPKLSHGPFREFMSFSNRALSDSAPGAGAEAGPEKEGSTENLSGPRYVRG